MKILALTCLKLLNYVATCFTVKSFSCQAEVSQIFFVVNVESSTLQQFRKLFGASERAGMISCSQMLQIYTREVTFENVQSAYCHNLIFLAEIRESTKCAPTWSQEVFRVAAHVRSNFRFLWRGNGKICPNLCMLCGPIFVSCTGDGYCPYMSISFAW